MSHPYCVECLKDDLAKEKADDRLARTTCSEFAGIQALVRIREGLGDPCGKLMQDELVEKVLNLVQGEKELREGVIKYIKDREEDGVDECVDELKFLLDYTQWWDWDIDAQNSQAQPPQVG